MVEEVEDMIAEDTSEGKLLSLDATAARSLNFNPFSAKCDLSHTHIGN